MTQVVKGLGILAAALSVSAALTAQEPTPAAKSVLSIADGSHLFRTYCVACHGATARGEGPLAASMRRKPPNLTELRKQNNNVYPADLVFRIIDGREKVKGHGGPDMPAWGDALGRSIDGPDEQSVQKRIQALVDYLETLQVPEP